MHQQTHSCTTFFPIIEGRKMFLSRVQKRFIFKARCDVSSDQNKISKCLPKIVHIDYSYNPCDLYTITSYKGFEENSKTSRVNCKTFKYSVKLRELREKNLLNLQRNHVKIISYFDRLSGKIITDIQSLSPSCMKSLLIICSKQLM